MSKKSIFKETIKPTALQETPDVNGNRRSISWKNCLESEYDRLLCKNIRININNPSIIPILTIKDDGRHIIRRCYPVNAIHPINLPEGDNCYNEDYCINSTNLVPTCNDSPLTCFFHDDDEDAITSFYLLTVSNVILDCVFNCKFNHINNKKKVPTTTVVALLISTSLVTSITKHNTDHTNNCQIYSKTTPIQVKQSTPNSYYPYTDGIFSYNPAMYIHYYAIRHSQLLLNHNQFYVLIMSMKRRKGVFLGTYAIQYQDIFSNILTQSDGLFKALFF